MRTPPPTAPAEAAAYLRRYGRGWSDAETLSRPARPADSDYMDGWRDCRGEQEFPRETPQLSRMRTHGIG